MDMISALNSINTGKNNLMRDDVGRVIESEERSYPSFPVLRSLSYHPDSILIANMLNEHGLREFNITPLMHYEFLLYALPKGRRFAKWARGSAEDDIDIIMEIQNVSYEKARGIASLITSDEMDRLRGIKGGDGKKTKVKKVK